MSAQPSIEARCSRQKQISFRPSRIYSVGKRVWSNPCNSSPLRYGLSLTADRDESIFSRVIRLFLICRPPAITWLVMAIIVHAIDLHAFRSFPHVGQEQFEVIPARANGDAAISVCSITGVLRIVAPIAHAKPSDISTSPFLSTSNTVFRPNTRGFFLPETPATRGSLAFQRGAEHHNLVSTLADAFPLRFVVDAHPGKGNHRETVKSLANKVFSSHASIIDETTNESTKSSI